MISFLRDFFAAPDARAVQPWKPLVIGLTAPAGSGKDSVAAYLEDRYAFVPIAFADPVRDMLATLLDHVDGDSAWLCERALKELPLPVLGHSYRMLAQSLGTDWGRRLVADDLWIVVAQYKLAQALEQGDNVVITDVRFPNEAQWLHDVGGTLVRVRRAQAAAVREHESEQHTHSLQVDHVLPNDSSLGALEHRIDALIDALRSTKARPQRESGAAFGGAKGVGKWYRLTRRRRSARPACWASR